MGDNDHLGDVTTDEMLKRFLAGVYLDALNQASRMPNTSSRNAGSCNAAPSSLTLRQHTLPPSDVGNGLLHRDRGSLGLAPIFGLC